MLKIIKSKQILLGFSLLAMVAAISGSQLQAQNTNSDQNKPDARFQLERDGEGFVRIDKKTGETSYCRRINTSLVCKLATEERDGFQDEIANLQSKLGAAKEKLNALNETGVDRPKTDVPDPDQHDDAGIEKEKIERELDKALDITKFTVRKLFGLVKELQKEFGD